MRAFAACAIGFVLLLFAPEARAQGQEPFSIALKEEDPATGIEFLFRDRYQLRRPGGWTKINYCHRMVDPADVSGPFANLVSKEDQRMYVLIKVPRSIELRIESVADSIIKKAKSFAERYCSFSADAREKRGRDWQSISSSCPTSCRHYDAYRSGDDLPACSENKTSAYCRTLWASVVVLIYEHSPTAENWQQSWSVRAEIASRNLGGSPIGSVENKPRQAEIQKAEATRREQERVRQQEQAIRQAEERKRQEEAQRIARLAEEERKTKIRSDLRDFLRRNNATEIVETSVLEANPFVYEGKNIGIVVNFVRMESRSEGLFDTSNNAFVVSSIPAGQFTNRATVLLIAKPVGRKQVKIPVIGDYSAVHLEYVAVKLCDQPGCRDITNP
jgi:hypothetical protein